MGLQVNIEGTSPESGGAGFSEKCDCHFIVEGYEDMSSKAESPYIEITVIALNSTVPSQVGRKRKEKYYLTPPKGGDENKKNPLNKLLWLACAIGMYSKPQWDADIEAKRSTLNLDLDAAIGRTFCAPVTMRAFYEKGSLDKIARYKAAGDAPNLEKEQKNYDDNKGKSFPSLGGDWGDIYWALGDPEADHVPLDEKEVAHFNGNFPTRMGGIRRRGAPLNIGGSKTPPPVNQPNAPAGGGAASLI